MIDINNASNKFLELSGLKDSAPREAPIRSGKFEDKVIAFIDILGMRQRIKGIDDNEAVGEKIKDILIWARNIVKGEIHDLLIEKDSIEYYQIGDGFIFITNTEHIIPLFKCIINIQCRLICEAGEISDDDYFLIRGAITYGKNIVLEDEEDLQPQVIGPAAIELYELESKNAIFPRIIVSKKLLNYVTELPPAEQNEINVFIDNDFDNIHFLKFYDYIDLNICGNLFKDFLKNEYEKYIEKSNTVKIAQKIGWVMSVLEDKIQRSID